ncbi:MAG: trypsin-like peptidase domain-containing protein [Dehalococcoidia bacterium]
MQYGYQYPEPESQPRRPRLGATFLTVVLSMIVGGLIVGGVTWAIEDDGGGGSPATVSDNTGVPVSEGDDNPAVVTTDFTELYQSVRDSVVRITTGDVDSSPFSVPQEGLGSGVVIDAEGNILTNFHVVRGFEQVTVTFADGSTAAGEVVGSDPGNDIAMVQVDVDPDVLSPATLGDSSAVRIGESVAALGNPFGLDGSFTTGVISGTGRTLASSSTGRPIRNLLQTDTAVNPGNSGGALFNLRGEVIGINTAIENPNGTGFVGIAYAVPINTPKRFLTELISGEGIDHPRLGISGRTLTQSEAADLSVPHGVAVISVDPDSAADDAGLRPSENGGGDVIVEIDGQAMESFEDLADYIDSKSTGDGVTLKVHRDGEDIELQATLRSWDSSA